MVYKVSVKRTWRFNDGSRLEPGMSVNVQSKQTSAANLLNAGMQDVSDRQLQPGLPGHPPESCPLNNGLSP